ncbi:hypothetical protein [Parahaliea aestuarii]|uniref:Uncharacterized protein n=1 Tax=Parahaliea aestuarii TaxID=1852021 RepID=A0A5C9A1U6_9GAMM|nr:hypothetical protein [Parahaliea aestuarii]TXS94686.1 hypothetical protein FVW59_01880 [Parahaliea aestuarii]
MSKSIASVFFGVFLGSCLFTSIAAFAEDFDAEYQGLIEDFRGSLNDSTALQQQVDKADALHDRIQQYRRDKRSELPKADLDQLRDLAREVRYFKSVTKVVGQLRNSADVDIEAFDTVNAQLQLQPVVLQQFDSGLEIVRIDVDGYGSLLIRNSTPITFTVTYSAQGAEQSGGVGSANCESYSVMSGLYNSRDRAIDNLVFTVDAHKVGVKACD